MAGTQISLGRETEGRVPHFEIVRIMQLERLAGGLQCELDARVVARYITEDRTESNEFTDRFSPPCPAGGKGMDFGGDGRAVLACKRYAAGVRRVRGEPA